MKLPNDQIIHYESKDGVHVNAEVKEVVHCKDCEHHEALLCNNDGKVLCWVHGLDVVVDRNGYCNYGEWKEQEHECK